MRDSFRTLSRLGLAAALPLIATAASATTIERIPDPALVDRSPVVVEATIEARLGAVGERPQTEWLVAIDRVLKGSVDTGRIVLRLPGGRRADGLALHIYGTPVLQQGGAAILFLRPLADGSYALADFPQGAFLGATSSRRRLALRDFSEVKIVGAGRAGAREPIRDFDRFGDWIEDRANGFVRAADYVVEPTRDELQSISSPFSFFEVDGRNLRWTVFDSGGTVTFRSFGSMPQLSGGGATELQRGLAAWTNEPTTPVRLAYGGSTSANGGLENFDFQNVVHWTDPNDEVATFDCGSGGGTIAIGGPWYDSSQTVTFNGQQFYRILEGDIVFADGIECKKTVSVNFSKFIEEVAGHEVGHTLGLGHSSERRGETSSVLKQALMYAFAHDDGRGARLNSDDIGGLQTLYRVGGATGGGGSKPPPAPSGCPAGTAPDTLCLLKGRFHLTGTWQNQFDGSSGVLRPIVNSDLSGFFYFTDKNNVELIVKVLDFGTEIKVFYSQLTNLKFTLNVRDSTTGRTKSYTNTAGDCGAIDPNFAAGAAASTASSLQSVAAAATASCKADASTLCLLDNRFAVTVTWRNQFNGASGAGKAMPLSRLTGAFAFDNPANLEILIKTLDFSDKILVLYGSLSNFEYTIRVTDTTTGIFKDYRNAAGNYCGGLDDNAF